MQKLALGLLVAGALLAGAPAFAYTSPGKPTGFVNDFAHVLDPQAKDSLELELVSYAAQTSNEIAAVIVPDMGGDYIEHYAAKLFEEWGIGTKKKDNGVLLLLSMKEHAMRIEVGYGLEGALPDSLAKSILENEMKPLLRAGDDYGAVLAGVRAIEKATKGEYTAPTQASSSSDFSIQDPLSALFFVIIGLQWIFSMLARSKSWWAGGILGFAGGLGAGWFFALGTLILPLAFVLGILGLVLDFVISRAYQGAKTSGITPPWWAGGGGFGGGRSGGGFGGFGGGGSGGGGASGRW